jgi:hypothetical protein
MAIRRAKQKAQVITKLEAMAPPGETFLACVHCETGPSPWLGALLDEIPLLGLALSRQFYFLAVTNTSVVVISANRFTNRPGEIVAVFPRHATPISDVKRAKVWSKLHLHFAGHSKPKRLNVHRYWRGEFDQLLAALPQTATAPQAQAPVAR